MIPLKIQIVKLFPLILCLTAVSSAQETSRQLGFGSYQNGDYASAVEQFQIAVKESPGDKPSWLFLGFAHLHLKNRKEANRAFSTFGKLKKQIDPTQEFFDEKFRITSKRPARITGVTDKAGGGKAMLFAELRADGKLGTIHIFRNNKHEWKNDLLAAVQGIGFEPAKKNGEPVTAIAVMEYSFEMF